MRTGAKDNERLKPIDQAPMVPNRKYKACKGLTALIAPAGARLQLDVIVATGEIDGPCNGLRKGDEIT